MPELWGRETKEDQVGPAPVPWRAAVLLAMTSGIPAQDRASSKLRQEAPFHGGQWKSPEGHIRQSPKQRTCVKMVGGKEGAYKTAATLGLQSKAALGEGWALLLMPLSAN